MMSTLSVSDPYENQRYQSNTENFGRAWAPAKLSKAFQKAYSKGKKPTRNQDNFITEATGTELYLLSCI